MSETTATSYDEVPYGNHVFSYSHPDRLATVATLLSVQPAPVDRCRVLELGCGTGFNLLPMACALPDSRFVGLDLSTKQIAVGHDAQRALGLSNLDLRAMSILDVDPSLGVFDYIICHGVYSWVPPAIQDKILAICKQNLAANGIAYVSYNTYPGWYLRIMVRDMMRFHVRQFPDPQERIQQAWALLDFLIESVGAVDSVYGRILQVEKEVLSSAPSTYLYHEHLEDANAPVYFHQFMERAAGKGLQYLSEARFVPMPQNLSPNVVATLESLAVDLLHGEQYLDFVRNRRFRWTLLCHDTVAIKRPPSAQPVAGMAVRALVQPVSAAPELGASRSEEFRGADGTTLTTSDPLFKTTLCILADAYPQAVPFGELWRASRARVAASSTAVPDNPDVLASTLLQCFLSELVELQVRAPTLVTMVSERPTASPLARLFAPTETHIPNLRHRMVELANDFETQVLLLLDGSRDRAEIVAALEKAVLDGSLEASQGDRHLRDLPNLREVLASFLDATLRRFANLSLLIG